MAKVRRAARLSVAGFEGIPEKMHDMYGGLQ